MTFLSTQPKEQREQQQVLAQTPGDASAFEPGLFEGSLTAGGVGLGRVGAIANQLAGEAEYQVGALFTRPLDALFDTDFTNSLDQSLRQAPAQLTADMTPDPYTTGTIGQILYSLIGVGVPAAVGTIYGGPAGGMALAGGFTGQGTFTDLTQQGVDPTTAAGAAVFEGGLMAIGVGAPAAIGGKVALNTLLYGPGINVAQSVIAGQGTGAWLEARGYDELADRYATYDAEMLAADIVLGAAFGYLGARQGRASRETVARPSTEAVDTAHVALDQRHVELDTAPGIPADLAAVKSHNANLQTAIQAMLDGRPVETAVPEGVFAPRSPNPAYADNVLVDAFRESGYPELLAEVKALEAELAARGRVVDDAPLPDLPAAMDRLEQAGARVGRVTDVKIGNEYAAARWTVMEADEVAPSVTVSENQLRDRTRAASELQVNKMAAELDPNLLLAEFPTMDVGAPTLTADGKVVAGNGRALAVRKAYSGEKGQAYRQALSERAAAYGLDPAAVEGMRQPVLVRVLQQAVDVERAAILSNESGAARMSNLEQARVDAGRLPSLAAVDLPESGDFTAASMAPFVRAWLGQFPETQLGGLLADDGKLSQEGLTRLRNAVLFRAYGDSDTLQRLVESTDPGARNVAAALVKAAPKVAEVKDAIARGELHPLDVSDAIVRTADLIEQIRDQGLTVDGWINQLDLFNPGETPATLALLRFVDANKRSAKAITEMLTGYYDAIVEAGNPGQGDMLGGAAPDQTTLLSNAIARAAPAKAAQVVQDSLFRPTRAAEETRAEAVMRGAERDAANFGMPEPERTLLDGDPLLQPRDKDMTPEREALRAQLIDTRFAGKDPAPDGKPVAIVMGGGGGAGKGTVLGRLKKAGIVPRSAVELDPDSFKLALPEYRKIVDAGDTRAASVTHDESKLLYDRALAKGVEGKYDLVLDRTLGTPAKALAEIQALKKAGYEVRLIGVTVEAETAIKRAVERAKGPDRRFVPIPDLLKAHKGFSQGWEQYVAVADQAILFSNEVPKGSEPKPLAGKAAGQKLAVRDESGYIAFSAKGKLNEQATTLRELQGSDPGAKPGPDGRVDAGRVRDPARGGRGGRPGKEGRDRRAVEGSQAAGDLPGGLDPAPILAARPDLTITTDDGKTAYAADTLAEVDTAAARAETDALGFEAAVNCFLRSAA